MSGRESNVGRRDRIARGVLTPVALGIAGWLYLSVPRDAVTLAAIGAFGVLAFIFVTGALTGTCGVYAALGIDTCSDDECEADYEGGSVWG